MHNSAIPWTAITGCLLLLAGVSLATYGIFLLVGLGWALIAAAPIPIIVGAAILRGLSA